MKKMIVSILAILMLAAGTANAAGTADGRKDSLSTSTGTADGRKDSMLPQWLFWWLKP